MSSLITGTFDSQFAAASAYERLASRGVKRHKAVVQCDESVGHIASSSSAPTTVVSRASHQGKREGEHDVLRAPDTLPPPSDMGLATLTVEIENDVLLEDVLGVMQSSGASDVRVTPDESLQAEDPALWPDQGTGSPTDVDRAMAAARGGHKPTHH